MTSVSLSAGDFVRLNNPQRFVLTALMSDGTSRVVEGTWQSSDQAVATIATDGLLSGVSSGQTTVTALYQSFRAERLVRIVPDYAGTWSGAYRVASCTDEGDWEGFCEGEDPSIEWALDMAFNQAGGDVAGPVKAFADTTISAVGAIAINGRLSMAGQAVLNTESGQVVLEAAQWDTNAFDSNRLMNGTFQIAISAPDLEGEFRYFCEITVLNKVATTPAHLTERTSGRALFKPLRGLRGIGTDRHTSRSGVRTAP